MLDNRGRTIDYMRVSLTDRCNLRCRYCMPNGIQLVSMEEILTYEEIELICRAAAKVGIRKLKITGGEPLVRLGCTELIGRLKQIPGIEQVTMTTNGVLLAGYMEELLKNGLDAVNISLDTLDRETYCQITGRDELFSVLEGIESAVSAGLPVKINAVLQKGINDKEWNELARFAKDRPVDVRFIEMMPIGYGKEYETISNESLIEQFKGMYGEIKKDDRIHGNGPAVYYQIPGYEGSIGFISAIHGKFCHTCNRIRLTSSGKLKPCLCYEDSVDLMGILRDKEKNGKEGRLQEAVARAVRMKPEAHCFENYKDITENRKMVQIGG